MTQTTTYIIAYFVGVIVSYLFIRLVVGQPWTIGARNKALLFSLLSWLSLFYTISSIITDYFHDNWNNNKKSKW